MLTAFRRPGGSGGSCCLLGGYSDPWIPLPKCGLPVAIQDARPDLEQQVGATWRPGHLLLLAEALAEHLIHSRLHKGVVKPQWAAKISSRSAGRGISLRQQSAPRHP